MNRYDAASVLRIQCVSFSYIGQKDGTVPDSSGLRAGVFSVCGLMAFMSGFGTLHYMRYSRSIAKSRFMPLHWRLTVTYVLVTALAALLIELLGGMLAAYLVLKFPYTPVVIAEELTRIAPGAAPYLSRSPLTPDTAAELGAWRRRIAADAETAGKKPEKQFRFGYVAAKSQTVRITLTDGQGNLLRLPDAPASENNMPLTRGEKQLIDRVLKGVRDPEHLAVREADGTSLAATGIRNAQKELCGVLVYRFSYRLASGEIPARFAEAFQVDVWIVVVCTSLVGLGFGNFVARRWTARLETVAQGTEQWSQGDFAHRVATGETDEMGQMIARLNRMAEELTTLIALKAQVAQWEERSRLARDLHDTVKQRLFALRMHVAAANRPEASDAERSIALSRADEAATLAQSEMAEILKTIHQPPIATTETLVDRLRSLANQWESNIAPITVEVPAHLPAFALETAQTVCRIVQEALANVAKHSGATAVLLEVEYAEPGMVSVTIADNGRGFSHESGDGGNGLRNMWERAQSLPKGSFSVQSAPGEGTQIKVIWHE